MALATRTTLFAALMMAAAPVSAAERPTQNGDTVGVASMAPDGTITLRMRSVECNGTIAEGVITVGPAKKDYKSTLDHLGGLKSGESKPIPAWPSPPCPGQ